MKLRDKEVLATICEGKEYLLVVDCVERLRVMVERLTSSGKRTNAVLKYTPGGNG